MLPVRPALAAAAAAAAASEPRLLLPPARDIPLPSATSARDVRCSRSPAPSAPAAKKKATADTSTGRPTPSATLLPPPPKVPDEVAKKCRLCAVDFSPFNRRHHCRDCGEIFCDKCSQGRIVLTAEDNAPLVRVCDRCMAEVTQRLSIAKEAATRSATVQSHEDVTSTVQSNEVPTELEAYLSKQAIPRSDDFDILGWWKNNSLEYPTLSRMARDVLVAPASSVPSESAFSLARRLISDFRSRLTPKTVEELMYLQDWFRASGSTKFSMESIDCCLLDEIQ